MERNISLKGFTTLILGLAAAALILPFIIPKNHLVGKLFSAAFIIYVNYFEGIATRFYTCWTSILLFFLFGNRKWAIDLLKFNLRIMKTRV